MSESCPFWGVKRTRANRLAMSANDPSPNPDVVVVKLAKDRV